MMSGYLEGGKRLVVGVVKSRTEFIISVVVFFLIDGFVLLNVEPTFCLLPLALLAQ